MNALLVAAALLAGCGEVQQTYGDYCDDSRPCASRPSLDFCDDAGRECAVVCLVARCDSARRSCLYQTQIGACPPDGGAPDGR